MDLFDAVFVLEVDVETLNWRLHQCGGPVRRRSGSATSLRLHRTKEDLPTNGVVIDATAPLDQVVDEIVSRAKLIVADDGRAHPPSP